jgi:5'-nucleotidase
MQRIFIDMDNTLCDYNGRFREMRKLRPEINYPQSQYGFFANLDPLPRAIESYRALEEKYEVLILTAPSYKNPLCYTEKRVWVEKHLGLETTQNLIICKRKELLRGDYLIDDHLYDFEGEFIHFGTAKFPDWDRVLSYLL